MALRKKTKKPPPKKLKFDPKALSSHELCLRLTGVAAFHTSDEQSQHCIYDAIRRLSMLEDAAIKAGLISEQHTEGGK